MDRDLKKAILEKVQQILDTIECDEWVHISIDAPSNAEIPTIQYRIKEKIIPKEARYHD